MGKIAAGVIAVIALAIGAMLLLRGGGEAGRIEATLRQAVDDARAGDADKCIGTIASDYAYDGQTYEQVCAMVRHYVGPDKWKGIDLTSIEVGVEGDAATARMRFMLEAGDLREFMGQRFPLKLNLLLKRTPDGWKITGHRVEQR